MGTTSTEGAASESGPRRRVPSQLRAVRTVEQLLAAAVEVLLEEGAEGITTNKIASRAGVNIATLYSYFADKNAVLETLAERFEDLRSRYVEEQSARLVTTDDWEEWFLSGVDQMVRFRTEEPGGTAIRRALLADPELHRLDEASTKRSAEAKIEGLLRHGPGLSRERASAISLVYTVCLTAVLDEAFRSDPYRQELVDEFKHMAIGYLKRYLGEPRHPDRS